MQIILLEKVVNLGNLGDIVRVKDGYARNFLIPGKKARRATKDAIAEFEVRRADLERRRVAFRRIDMRPQPETRGGEGEHAAQLAAAENADRAPGRNRDHVSDGSSATARVWFSRQLARRLANAASDKARIAAA